MDYFKKKNIEKLSKAQDPTEPEKCFYDYEMKDLHSIFVSALKNNIAQLKKIKGLLLPSICILDMVANRKVGWDKFLDSQQEKYGSNNRKSTLLAYLKENYDKTIAYINLNNLDFLTKPYPIDVPFEPPRINPSTNLPEVDPVTGKIKMDSKTINAMEEFQKLMSKKVDGESI
jgi:hypothetical protein